MRRSTQWLRVAEVALLFGVSKTQVRLLIHNGELAARRCSSSERGMFLVHQDEANRYLAGSEPVAA